MEHSMLQLAGNTHKLTDQMSSHSLYYINHTFTSPAHAAPGRLLYRYNFCCNLSGRLSFVLLFLHISEPNDTRAHYFLHKSNSERSTSTTLVWRYVLLHILQFYCFQFFNHSKNNKNLELCNSVTRHTSDMSWQRLADACLTAFLHLSELKHTSVDSKWTTTQSAFSVPQKMANHCITRYFMNCTWTHAESSN
jgi:hypothetical protein